MLCICGLQSMNHMSGSSVRSVPERPVAQQSGWLILNAVVSREPIRF